MKNQKGKIITITSCKGGVGKTTIALNLAGMFHLIGKKTLIIDFDIYSGGVAASLNLDFSKTIYNLVDDISNNRYKNIEDYITKYNDNIDILPACVDPRQGNKINPKYISNILGSVVNKYEIILLDTSHIMNDFNIVLLDNSDTILYIMTNDPIDIKNTKSFVSIVKDAEINNVKLVLNNAVDLNKSFFSDFDIRTIIKSNIDYTISSSFFIPNIDKYVMEGEILLLNKGLTFRNKKDYKKFMLIANDLAGGENNE